MIEQFYFFVCLNIFIILFATIPDVYSQAVLVKSQNWIPVDENWPTEDKNSKQPFYFIHADEGQTDGRSLDFNQKFFNKINGSPVKPPYLKFKYWSTTDKAALRYKFIPLKHNETVYLSQTKTKWKEAPVVKNIDKNRWGQLNFFINDKQLEYEAFTTAFKDVQVDYIDRQPLESFQSNPVHSHKGDTTQSPNIKKNFPLEKLNVPPETDKSRLLIVFQNWAEVLLPNPVYLEFKEEKPEENIELLRFKLQALPHGEVQTVTLKLETWKNSCQNDLHLQNSVIECKIVDEKDKVSHGKKYRKTLKSFRIFLTGQNTDFAIWNAESTANSTAKSTALAALSSQPTTPLPQPTPVKLITTSAPVEKYRYNVKLSQNESFVNIVESLEVGKDWCYSVGLNNLPRTAKMDVYLTLHGAPQGTQIASLTTSESNQKRFCINEYLPFANLERYQLTFSVAPKEVRTSPFSSTFFFDYSKQAADSEKDFKLIEPTLSVNNLTSNQWLHFNPSLDYTITRQKELNSKMNFSFCDQTLNCFPFEEEQSSGTTVYKLPQFASSVLAGSPFLRLKIDNFKADELKQFTFYYFSPKSKTAFGMLKNLQTKPGPLYNSKALSKCPQNFEVDGTSTSCKLTSAYKAHVVECDDSLGCSNIFSKPLLSTTKYYNEATSDINSITYLPYLTTHSNEPFLSISLSKKSNQDVCISFNYFSRSLPLFITTNTQQVSNASVELSVMGETSSPGRACASWFARSASKVDSFIIRFKTSGVSLTDVDGHMVILPKSPLQLKPFPQDITLEKGVYKDNDLKSIFVDGGSSSSPLLTINSNSIKYLFPNWNSLPASQLTSVSYLRSKWIRMSSKLVNKLLLSWTADLPSFLLSSDVLQASLTFSRNGGTDLLTLQGQSFLVPQQTNPQVLSAPVDYVQLIIKVKVNLTAAKTATPTTTSNQLNFELTDLLLNDPCYLSLNSGDEFIQCLNNGHCDVASYADYTTKCACKGVFYSGTFCEVVDFCRKNKGFEHCQSSDVGGFGCTNNQATQDYECQCGGGKAWDLTLRTCLPQVPSCRANEVAKLSANRNNYICECVSGTVEVDRNCVLYDVCNPKHRKAKGDRPIKPCVDKNADCRYSGSSYECKCKDKTFNEGNYHKSGAVCIPEEMRNCAQGYRNGTGGYECACNAYYQPDGKGGCVAKPTADTSKCTPKKPTKNPLPFLTNGGKNCQCPMGFLIDNKSITCEIDQSLATNYGCEKLEMKTDGKLGCICSPGQKFDWQGCSQTECDDQTLKNCRTNHQSGCRFDTKLNKAVCECIDPTKEVKLANTDLEAKNGTWKCVSKCDYLLRNKKFEEKSCTGDFTRCEPTYLNSFGDLLNGIFSLKSSTIKSTQSEYCKCEIGFVPIGNGHCGVNRKSPVRFIRGMEFDLLGPPEIKDKFIVQARTAFIELIKEIFSVKSLVSSETDCKLKSAFSSLISCKTGFEYEGSENVIRSRLIKACKPLEGNSNKCSYLTPSPVKNLRQKRATTTGDNLNAILIRDRKAEIPVSTINYCKDFDPCYQFPHSECHNTTIKGDNNEPVPSFNCTCNTDYYNRVLPVVDPKTKKPIQPKVIHLDQTLDSCTSKDFCKQHKQDYKVDYCHDGNATCRSGVWRTHAGDLRPVKFCICPGSDRPLVNNTFQCQSLCTKEYCSGHGVCAQDMYKALIICKCNEGWTGNRCELRTDANQSSTRGLLVGAIVVSLVAVLSIIAIVVVYLRRKDELPLDWQIARKIQRGGRWGGSERRRGSQIRLSQGRQQQGQHQQARRQRYPSWGDDQ